MNNKIAFFTLIVVFVLLGIDFSHAATYSYDALNRIINVEYSAGYSIAYQYDSVGNRTTRIVLGHDMPVPDINGSGKVDLGDYAILASQWMGAPGTPSADIAYPFDGIVDNRDLMELTESWLDGVVVEEPVTVFEADFESGSAQGQTSAGVTASFSGETNIAGTQGFSSWGMGSNFLWNKATGNPETATVLTLQNLPSHTSVEIVYHFCQIESWDGTDSDDLFTMEVDSTVIQSGAFMRPPYYDGWNDQSSIEYGDSRIIFFDEQLIKTHTDDVAGGNHYRETAYRMGQNELVTHTGSTLEIRWYAGGSGWQGGNDESWAIDNIEVILH